MKINIFLVPLIMFSLNSIPSYGADPANNRPSTWLMVNACAGCHGSFGHSLGATPSIAGLPEDVFIKSMIDYKSGARPSTVMDRIARGYTEADFIAMAKFFNKR